MTKKEILKVLEKDYVEASKKMKKIEEKLRDSIVIRDSSVIFEADYFHWEGRCHYIVEKYIEISGLNLLIVLNKLKKAEQEH